MACRINPSAGRSWLALLVVALAAMGMALSLGVTRAPATAAKTCPSGYVDAQLSWGEKCLHAGQFCKVGNVEYHQYGFDCPADGHLVAWNDGPATTTTTAAPATTGSTVVGVKLGKNVLLSNRTRSRGCHRGALPDRRCSLGAYYSGLTKAVVCSSNLRTSSVRNVPQWEKYAVEREYGMAARSYGRTIEIDHIVSLELGGSNDIANLYPEPGAGAANYHDKDKLENKLHGLVCGGSMTLRTAQRSIASNWKTLYVRVFHTAPWSCGF